MRRILTIMALWLATLSIAAQDTIFVDRCARWTNRENAVEYAFVTKKTKKLIEVKSFDFDNRLRRIEEFSVYNGIQRIRNGKLTQFYPNGKLRRKETYKNNDCTGGKFLNEKGKKQSFVPYYEAPSYPKGAIFFLQELKEATQYPSIAQYEEISGTVVMRFIINADGYITNPKVLKSANPLLGEAAVKGIKKIAPKCKWIPAKLEGKPIEETFILPVKFHLQ